LMTLYVNYVLLLCKCTSAFYSYETRFKCFSRNTLSVFFTLEFCFITLDETIIHKHINVIIKLVHLKNRQCFVNLVIIGTVTLIVMTVIILSVVLLIVVAPS
jgi:hypothetical protein